MAYLLGAALWTFWLYKTWEKRQSLAPGESKEPIHFDDWVPGWKWLKELNWKAVSGGGMVGLGYALMEEEGWISLVGVAGMICGSILTFYSLSNFEKRKSEEEINPVSYKLMYSVVMTSLSYNVFEEEGWRSFVGLAGMICGVILLIYFLFVYIREQRDEKNPLAPKPKQRKSGSQEKK